MEEQLPTIVLVAHYDAHGIAPVSLCQKLDLFFLGTVCHSLLIPWLGINDLKSSDPHYMLCFNAGLVIWNGF